MSPTNSELAAKHRGRSGGISFEQALDEVDAAARAYYAADPGVRAVGIGAEGDGFGFHVVRRSPRGGRECLATSPTGVPVKISDTTHEITSLARLPRTGSRVADDEGSNPERDLQRPVCAGLQIQNLDANEREGGIERGLIAVSTIGCIVRTVDGTPSVLSNNHGIAAMNRGRTGEDRILQPGRDIYDSSQHIAMLGDFVRLRPSPYGARPHLHNVSWNVVDAALATLREDVASPK